MSLYHLYNLSTASLRTGGHLTASLFTLPDCVASLTDLGQLTGSHGSRSHNDGGGTWAAVSYSYHLTLHCKNYMQCCSAAVLQIS